MKPHQFVFYWFAAFASYLLIVFSSYGFLPEGILLELITKYTGDISGESWDNFMGYVIFIGSALVNAVLIWIVVSIYQRATVKKH
ncbi:hypothetical protein [Buttiauxella noackiae]|uniref:hypothetical protein n=1 Tax=Buttiauxella noackiae TaxID=82992 RepID=UPI0028D44743|nr:hypothetical protein [Buttiauxella noackiae]